MILSDVSVRRPVFAAVLSMLIVVFGILAFTRLPVRQYPDIDPPIVSVETTYPGAAASVIETRITQIIEDRISGIEGIRSISSSSADGVSSISVEFFPGRDVNVAANDIRDRVSGVLDNLPDEADPPEIQKVDADARPIIFINVDSTTMSPLELTDYADRFLADKLSTVEGVARVQISGGGRPAMRIWLNRASLAAYQLTTSDIERALRAENVELPAGRIQSTTRNLTIRVERAYQTAEQFRQLVIKRGEDGYLVRLGDVAQVEVGPENPYTMFRGNGNNQVSLGMVRQSGANELDVGNAVIATVKELNPSLPKGMSMVVSYDRTRFIDAAIFAVYETLLVAAVLVVLVIYLFLGSLRATLIPAITVPICLFGAFITLAALGFSINLLTLLALVLAIGLVVDDAIVVLENVHYRIEEGESPLAAAYTGTRQVGFAVIATTLVVCAVFVPVMFLTGDLGLLFRELSFAVIGALLVSALVALTLTPALCSKIMKPHKPGEKPRGMAAWVDARLAALTRVYGRTLRAVIGKGFALAGASVVVVAGCLTLGAGLKSELIPPEDSGIFFLNATAPQGTGFEPMKRQMIEIEQRLLKHQENGLLSRLLVRAPGRFGATEDFGSGTVIAILPPWGERDFTTDDVVNKLRPELAGLPGVRASAFQPSGLGGFGGQVIQFVIGGGSYADLAKARDILLQKARAYPGIAGLEADYEETKPQLLVNLDTTRAGDLGVSATDVGQTLETMMGSRRVTTYNKDGEEYRVILQAREEDRLTPNDLNGVYVRSQISNQLIPLSNVLSVREQADAPELNRYNRLRAITLEGDVAEGYSLGEVLQFLETEARQIPEVQAIDYRGESREFRSAGSQLPLIFGLTLIVVFLVLAGQFESFIHPAVIMLTVPLALGGGVLGLAIMGVSINIYSQIGIIMLVGLAAKNGILIVEFANQLRDSGLSVRDAAQQAAERRLRPILMTSIATIAGAIPLMVAHGAGAGARIAIGTVVVWGVLLSTLLTLYLIPAIYNKLARFTTSPEAVARQLKEQLEGGSPHAAE